jgi:hypothetical protein
MTLACSGGKVRVCALPYACDLTTGITPEADRVLMALLTHLYEHPACQAPHTPFSFLSSCPPFLLFDRAAGFLSPRPRIVAGRRAQGVSRLAAFQRPPSGLGLYTTEHDGRLDGSGRLHSYLIFSSFTCRRGCYCIPITDVIFWQVLLRGPWRVR